MAAAACSLRISCGHRVSRQDGRLNQRGGVSGGGSRWAAGHGTGGGQCAEAGQGCGRHGPTVAAIPTTDETTRTLSRTAPGALDEQQVDRPASAIAAAGDSSDEEGAHKPPPPPPEPAPPPAPPLTQPGPQLAQQIARLAAALPRVPPPRPASTQQPRTTRVTADLRPKGHV